MKITLKGTFKSLYDLESDEIGDFTVITGKNGSGKSHFVELLTETQYNQEESKKFELDLSPSNYKGGPSQQNLEFIDVYGLTSEQWKSPVKRHLNTIKKFSNEEKMLIELLPERYFDLKKLDPEWVKDFLTEISDGKDLLRTINESRLGQGSSNEGEFRGIQRFTTSFKLNRETMQLMRWVSKFRKKRVQDLNKADYLNSAVDETLLLNKSLFHSAIGMLFYFYAKRRDININQLFRKKELKKDNDSISDEQFIKENPPPWDQMNEILEEHNLDFRFQGIDIDDFLSDEAIDFDLIQTRVQKSVKPQDLSSGEKIIVGLITKVFLSSYLKDKTNSSRFLVFDEPDAHLHPEMSGLLVDVLQKTFIQKLGMQIIITTHSPSTVALCPEESIYEIRNGENSQLAKISKDHALNLLTGSLPTLSIDYKNHKQVFVESETDRYYYQTIYDKLHEKMDHPFKLYFIPYGNVKGGSCEQVKGIVANLREAGNKNCFGIIDWDLENSSNDHVIVHGEDKRYSIENYLLDPIYLAILFLEKDGMQNIKKELNFADHFNPTDLKEASNKRLQKIWGWFLGRFCEKFKAHDPQNKQTITIKYVNGKEVCAPEWYVMHQGHSLEEKYKEVFPVLSQKFRNAGELKTELSKIVARVYPLIPLDTQEVFDELMGENGFKK